MLLSEWYWNCIKERRRKDGNQVIMPSKPMAVKNNFTRCMMKTIERTQMENMELLKEIIYLKTTLSEIYKQDGPSSSEYINLSIKLNSLMHKYFEEKTESLVNI
ncbi:hypothetical protein [Bacillus sp. X1(2014)]|uniref:hypothetical protein n=1 Tax=Bacillus sp. X1(2014) TaxID=1565991 RepID=UPI0011A58F73|nr:hypothetical protein [Bacillus sp. X1(2014)]